MYLDLNQTDGKLHKGDRLVSRSTNGHTLIIPGYNNPTILQLKKKADSILNPDSTIRGKLEVLTCLVYLHFTNHDERKFPKEMSLDYAIENRMGVCKEFAAALHMLLNMYGIHSRYVKGNLGSVGHAWLKVDAEEDGEVLIDPSYNFSGCSRRYDDFKKVIMQRTGELYQEDLAVIQREMS